MVYVVQESTGKNVLPARRFGELETLLPPFQQIQLDSSGVVGTCGEKLRNYCDGDHILAIGDPVAIAIAAATASNANAGRFSILKWDRQEQTYFPVAVDLGAA